MGLLKRYMQCLPLDDQEMCPGKEYMPKIHRSMHRLHDVHASHICKCLSTIIVVTHTVTLSFPLHLLGASIYKRNIQVPMYMQTFFVVLWHPTRSHSGGENFGNPLHKFYCLRR